MNARDVKGLPRLALRSEEAAGALGVSDDFFREHIAAELRTVRRGRLRLYAISEIERWLRENSAVALEVDR